MGFLSKIFKGIKKFVKKIGRGIKKVARKIGKAVNKLGIVGQIGMMFLMPYAVGALGSFFGATGTLSNWGAALLKGTGIASKALGHKLNAINTVGTMAGKVYTGVTNTIGASWDAITGKGTLADVGKAAKSIFTGPAESLKLMDPKFIAQKHYDKKLLNLQTDVLTNPTPENLKRLEAGIKQPSSLLDSTATKVTSSYDQKLLDLQQKVLTDPTAENLKLLEEQSSLGGVDTTTAALQQTPAAGEKIPDIVAPRSLFEKGKDIFQEGLKDAKADLRKKAVGTVKDTITVKGMELLGLEGPQQGEDYGRYKTPTPDFVNTDSGIDFTNSYVVDSFAKQGNNHLAYGLANLGHVSSIYDPSNNPTTNSFMTDYYLAPNVARQIGAA